MALSIQRAISMHHSPNVLPISALEEGVVRDLLHCLPNPVLRVTEEAVDEVLSLGGDRRELGGEDEVLAPVHDLVVCLCRRDGRGLRGGGEGKGGIWIYFLRIPCMFDSQFIVKWFENQHEGGGRREEEGGRREVGGGRREEGGGRREVMREGGGRREEGGHEGGRREEGGGRWEEGGGRREEGGGRREEGGGRREEGGHEGGRREEGGGRWEEGGGRREVGGGRREEGGGRNLDLLLTYTMHV